MSTNGRNTCTDNKLRKHKSDSSYFLLALTFTFTLIAEENSQLVEYVLVSVELASITYCTAAIGTIPIILWNFLKNDIRKTHECTNKLKRLPHIEERLIQPLDGRLVALDRAYSNLKDETLIRNKNLSITIRESKKGIKQQRNEGLPVAPYTPGGTLMGNDHSR